MDTTTMYRHIFEAFSSLSDVQDLIEMSQDEIAQQRADHAKRHLGANIERDQEGFAEAVALLPLGCSLTGDEEKG